MTEYLRPKDVAKRLGVSPSGLRRLASIYSARYGDMPRDEGANRLWPTEAVARLEVARGLVNSGRARSIDEALEAVERGLEAPTEAVAISSTPPLSVSIAEVLKPMMDLLEAQESDIRAMRQELAFIREQLAPARRPWWNFWK
jgi:DNA-binding transcriptional MerR regulator